MASDGTRTVVATYDQLRGDLVLVDLAADNSKTYKAMAGVPDVTPTYDPDTYRGGVETAGENAGTWTSVSLREGRAAVAFHNIDLRALGFAPQRTPATMVRPATSTKIGLL